MIGLQSSGRSWKMKKENSRNNTVQERILVVDDEAQVSKFLA